MHYFDPHPASAAWPRTATLDWCEENYVASSLIAELYNSLSNIIFVVAAAAGLRTVYRARLPPRVALAFASIIVIGLGSFIFHATLAYTGQLLDELPMIYCVCVLTYNIAYRAAKKAQMLVLLRSLLILDALVISTVYIVLQDPLFHQVAFGAHVSLLLSWQCRTLLRLPSTESKRVLMRLLLTSLVSIVSGFSLWNLDNVLCWELRALRRAATLHYGPWLGGAMAACLQLHAWWHVLMALGAYTYVMASSWLDLLLHGGARRVQLRQLWGVPILAYFVARPKPVRTSHSMAKVD